MTASAPVPVLIVSGTIGVGKSAVASEMSEILCDRQVPHAYVDLDSLSWSWPPVGQFNNVLAFKNLAAVWANYREVGCERLIVSYVVECLDELDCYRQAVPGASITVCRLVASQATRESRIRQREIGAGLEWHLNRTVELEEILQKAALEDFQVENDGRPIHDVALEVLEKAGWLW
jgi:hypothetical protein